MPEIAWEDIVDDLRASDPEITESLDYILRNAPESWGLANLFPSEKYLDLVWALPGNFVQMCIAREGVLWRIGQEEGILDICPNPVTASEALSAAQGHIK